PCEAFILSPLVLIHVARASIALATSSKGADVAPGSDLSKYTEPARCPTPFMNMMALNTHDARRVPTAPRRTAGAISKRTTTSIVRPANQTPKVNVGIGNQEIRDRTLSTRGL